MNYICLDENPSENQGSHRSLNAHAPTDLLFEFYIILASIDLIQLAVKPINLSKITFCRYKKNLNTYFVPIAI